MIFEAFDPLNPKHAEYFQGMPSMVCADTQGIVAVNEKLEIQGFVHLYNWTKNSVTADFKVSNPMCFRQGGLMSEVCEYVFGKCGFELILATVRENSYNTLKLDEKIGFKKDYLIPRAFSKDEGIWVLSMNKDNCRYYEESRSVA